MVYLPSARAASLLEEPLVRCSSTAAAVTHRFRLCFWESDAVPLSLIRAPQNSPMMPIDHQGSPNG